MLKKIVCIHILTIFLWNNYQAQLLERIVMFGDDEAYPARFDHFNFSINHPNWINELDGVETSPFSYGFDVGFYKDIPINKKGTFSFALGINYSASAVYHNANIVYFHDSTADDVGTRFILSNDETQRNKFYTSYIEAPVEFRLRTLNARKFRFYPGFKVGALIRVTNLVIKPESKVKTYRIRNANIYRYGPTLKIGYGKWNLQGFYSLTPLFTGETSDEIYPFTVGLTFFLL